MAKVESTVKRVMARDEFPYEWDVIENDLRSGERMDYNV